MGRSRARDEDVAALDAAAAPVYEELRSDPTADLIGRIGTIKDQTAAAAPVAGCDETADTAVAGSVVPTIPDATYTRVATRESALAAGLDPGVVDDILGPDGELTIVYRFDNGRWAASGNFNGGDAVEVGDGGTYAFDDSGRLVTTSQSGGCHGCVGVIEWTLADRVLTMKLVPFDGQPRPYQDDEILMTDGEYQSDQ